MSGKGEAYLAEAHKALNKQSFFSSLLGTKGQKYEEAADFFKKAGNAFKAANKWDEAGHAFLQEADAWFQAGDNKTDAVNALVEAGNCFKRYQPVEAVNAFKRAIEHFNENGRFGMSARYFKEIAEIFEADHNTVAAAEAYEQAAQSFERDNKKSNANTCMLKVAGFVSEKGELMKAAKIYEDIGKESLGKSLSSFSAKGHFLNALLCYLALGDQVQVRNKLEEYKGADYSFTSSRECDFLTKLLEAAEAYDGDSFSQHCADFDRITPLDPWKTSMLLKAKHFISEAAGGDEPDLS